MYKKLKNNEASGYDLVINDFLKNSADILLPIFLKHFNLNSFNSFFLGKVDNRYNNTNIKKGEKPQIITEALHYCLVLFTSAINRRVSRYLEEYGEKQAGLRSGNSTLDHIFSLTIVRLWIIFGE